MQALYHLTIPNSPMADCEAVAQDVHLLQQVVPGRVVRLYPVSRPGTRIPRALWGFQHLLAIRRAERFVDFHHIFNPDPFPFPVLRFLRKPVVYSVVGGIRQQHLAMALRLAQLVQMIVVSTATDAERLRCWGIDRVHYVLPAVETSRFSYVPLAADAPPVLLAGSAPWTIEQFVSKGVDALLTAAQRRRDLRLIFLWRGVLFDEMMRRVRQRHLEQRVQVLNERVDVNAVLSVATAAVVLADRSDIVKAHPHSLLESLAAGRPVLVSRAVPMSEWVEQSGLGLVIEKVEADAILDAVDQLRDHPWRWHPSKLQDAVRFRKEQFVESYKILYTSLTGN